MASNGSGPLRPSDLEALPGPRRVDRLRRALRDGGVLAAAVATDLDDWIALWRSNPSGPLRVLLIEMLEAHRDPRVDRLLEDALDDRADGVRLESLRVVLDRDPPRTGTLVRERLDDPSLEVRLFAIERLHGIDRDRAIDAALRTLSDEARGPREMHALDRVTELLVEDDGDPALAERLRALIDEVDDPEGTLDWAIEMLSTRRTDR